MRTLFALLGSCALAFNAFGQGQVAFANTTTTLFTTNGSLWGQGTGPTTGLNQYGIGLYVAPDGTTDPSLFTLIAVATNRSTPFRGLFSFPQAQLTIAGNNGTPIAYQVKAWSLSFGSSSEAAILSTCTSNSFPGKTLYAGRSAIGRVTPSVGGAGVPVPGLFGSGDFSGQLTNGIVLVPLAPPEFCFCPPRFSAIRAGGTNVTLRLERVLSSDSCYDYELQVASFVSGPWTHLTYFTPLWSSNGVAELTDTNPPTPRYYRVSGWLP